MNIITASAMYPYISILLNESERREAEDASFDMEARARGYVPERTCTFTESNGLDDSPMPTCSACGYVANSKETVADMISARIWYPYHHCLNCGAKVLR